MTICLLIMTKLQLILNYKIISIFGIDWHKGCMELNNHNFFMFIK